ncbi:MAG TPA: TMEM175 family protein [Hyphomicrobiales bacterium]|nr:TMEM175 family protein [Hyphomicrobiales bacterium]
MAEGRDAPPGTGRIEAFSDGVIAIIITIMVLELRAPAEAFASGHVATVIAALGPNLVIYALSFFLVAVMLVNHHGLMRVAPRATTALFWWNANLLFWMSLIPLSTAVFGAYPKLPLAVAFYGAVLAANSISFTQLHRCVDLIDGELLPKQRKLLIRDTATTALFALSVPLAYVSVYLSWAIFAILPAVYFAPVSVVGREQVE